MNTNHLKYILTIARHKNISNAANELYISQPALTKTLNTIEDYYNIKIFDRSHTPLQITYAGMIFLEEARKTLEAANHLESQMKFLVNGEKGCISFGIPGSHGTLYLPHLLPAFKRKCPNITLNLTEAHISVLEEKLLNGDIDICFCTLPVSLETLDYITLFDDPMVIACSINAPFAKQFDLSRNTLHTPYLISGKDLDHQSFNLGDPAGGIRRIANDMFTRHCVHPDIIHSFARHETAIRVTAADEENLIITPCLSAQIAHLENKLAFFTLDNPVLYRKKIICYRKGQILSPEARLLIETIEDIIIKDPEISVRNVRAIPALYH